MRFQQYHRGKHFNLTDCKITDKLPPNSFYDSFAEPGKHTGTCLETWDRALYTLLISSFVFVAAGLRYINKKKHVRFTTAVSFNLILNNLINNVEDIVANLAVLLSQVTIPRLFL